MSFEVQKITQFQFDRHWTLAVKSELLAYLSNIEKWSRQIDQRDFFWSVDAQFGASLMWVHLRDEFDENHSYVYATTSGDFALIRHELHSFYKIIVISKNLRANIKAIQVQIANALRAGGEFCDGERDLHGALAFPVSNPVFIYDTAAIVP